MEIALFISKIKELLNTLGNWQYVVIGVFLLQAILAFFMPFVIFAINNNIKRLNRTLKKIEKDSKEK